MIDFFFCTNCSFYNRNDSKSDNKGLEDEANYYFNGYAHNGKKKKKEKILCRLEFNMLYLYDD